VAGAGSFERAGTACCNAAAAGAAAVLAGGPEASIELCGEGLNLLGVPTGSVDVMLVVYVVGLMDHLYLKHEVTRYKAGLEHLYSIELTSRESIDLVSGVAACHNNAPRSARCFRGVKARYRKLTNIRLSRPAIVLAVGLVL
jgi:hypothetical protein